MRPPSDVKLDLDTSRSLGDIIDVLKAAALIQLRSFQLKDKHNESFLKGCDECFDLLPKQLYNHPFFKERKQLPSCIVVVTSDEGFLGELNTLLVNAALDRYSSSADTLVVLGERGARYLEDVHQDCVRFPGISEEAQIKEAVNLKNYLIDIYRKRSGRVVFIYPHFVSLIVQRVAVLEALPYQLAQAGAAKPGGRIPLDFIVEPGPLAVLHGLMDLWLTYKIIDIFWYSKLSEFAARIMHLESSTQELEHLNQGLSQEYFRLVHGQRDKVIREITASKLMLDKKRGVKLVAESNVSVK